MFGRTCTWKYNGIFMPTEAMTSCGRRVKLSWGQAYPKYCPYCGGVVRKR